MLKDLTKHALQFLSHLWASEVDTITFWLRKFHWVDVACGPSQVQESCNNTRTSGFGSAHIFTSYQIGNPMRRVMREEKNGEDDVDSGSCGKEINEIPIENKESEPGVYASSNC